MPRRIDVVVHLHGFSRAGAAMALAEKVPRSGLDLSRRTRPTLAMLPRGNWLRYSWYDHPAMLAGGLDRLTEYALARFAASLPGAPGRLEIDRLILTAHSGGGMPALDAIAAARRTPDELHIFDGLYGRDPAAGDPMRGIETIEEWLGRAAGARARTPGRAAGRLYRAADRPVLAPGRRGDRAPAERGRAGARGGAAPALPGRALDLAARRIAERCGPDLLAASDAEFDRSR